MDLLRINTAGSVDDGKSTLIGRFLNDSNALTIEQEELIVKKTKEKDIALAECFAGVSIPERSFLLTGH